MRFNRFDNLEAYKADVLHVLLEDEAVNNLPVSIITSQTPENAGSLFMGTVTDEANRVALAALCLKPFNMLLYAPRCAASDNRIGLRLLAENLHNIGFAPPGVFAQTQLARSFAAAYAGKPPEVFDRCGNDSRPMLLMRLESLQQLPPSGDAAGTCRVITENDLPLTASWEQSFSIECRLPVFPLDEYKRRIRKRIGRGTHYIWENCGKPVSQAVFGRETPAGAVINWVYTPPAHRSCGYAAAVVTELSKTLLARGKKFCCLFADAENEVSCGLYSKLGYKAIAEFEEITF